MTQPTKRRECPEALAPLARVLGFAVERGSVVWYREDAEGVLRQHGTIRPATSQEVKLWRELSARAPVAERTLHATEELAARWHRHRQDDGDFSVGMLAGWTQAIALLLGTGTNAVHDALENGEL